MRKIPVLLAASVVLLSVTAAGCGGSDSGSSGSSGTGSSANVEQAVKFAQCMRQNGVTNFPDPQKNGKFMIPAGGPDRNSPQVKKAQQACKSLQPPGFEADAAERAKDQEEWLKFTHCMRRQGIANFPDPQDGRLLVDRTKVNVKTPQFKKALNACRNVAHVGGSENANG
jgi:hypothetical protein